MIADLTPYPEYRPAEGGWLGEIPSHWEVRRMKYVVRETDSRSMSGKEQLLRVSQYTGVTQRRRRDGLDEPDTRAESLMGYKRVEPNDLVINIMLAWNGSMGVSQYSGIASPAYCVYRFASDFLPWYFHNLLRSPAYKSRIKEVSTGVVESRLRLYSDDLYRIEAMVPPPDEQAAIVRFLDWANARLERMIRAKRKVIALLTEQKQAIIHCAVTRGLDPSVPLKPSGIPWLGEIPQHWNVRKMKVLVWTSGGMTPNKSVARFWEGGVPWVSPKDMKVREIADSQDHITEAALRETNISLIHPPAVLIVVRGMILARTFPIAVTTVPVTVNQDMKALIPKPEVNADFLVSLLTGIRRELLSLVEEAGHGTRCLRTDSWANFSVPLPPLPEQLRINERLKSETAEVNAAITRFEHEIELLREYRTRLVADVVTGKLDVREAAARLPDDTALDISEDAADLSDEIEPSDEEVVV